MWTPSRLFDGKEVTWHHFSCLGAYLAKAKDSSRASAAEARLYGTEDLAGANLLRWNDQVSLRKHFGEIAGSQTELMGRAHKHDIHYFSAAEQNRIYWLIKDRVRFGMSLPEQRYVLSELGFEGSGGEEVTSTRLAEFVLYGVPPPCPECGSFNLAYARGHGGYRCHGATAWGKCTYSAPTVVTREFVAPLGTCGALELARLAEALRLGTAGELFNEWEAQEAEVDALLADVRARRAGDASLFAGLTFSLAGALPDTPRCAYRLIEALGGSVASTNKTDMLLTTEAEIASFGTEVRKAHATGATMVRADWLAACLATGVLVQPTGGPWDLTGRYDAAAATAALEAYDRQSNAMRAARAAEQSSTNGEESASTKQRVRAAMPDQIPLQRLSATALARALREVDPRARERLGPSYVVAPCDARGERLYTATLAAADVSRNTNSFYGMQLLEDTQPAAGGRAPFVLFIKWGRVGAEVGGCTAKPHASFDEAFFEFGCTFLDKSGNAWADRHAFVKQPRCMDLSSLEQTPLLDDDVAVPVVTAPPPVHARSFASPSSQQAASSSSPQRAARFELGASVAELVGTLFAQATRERTLRALLLDTTRIPLERLSARALSTAYGVLREIEALLASRQYGQKLEPALVELSSRFYTVLPHDCGAASPPLLDSLVLVRAKAIEIEALRSVVHCASLAAEPGPVPARLASQLGLDETARLYAKLGTRMRPVPRDSREFAVISQYAHPNASQARPALFASKHAPLDYALEVTDVFQLARLAEARRAPSALASAAAATRRLALWHGTRTSNLASILSAGLAPAPAEAPHTGYNYGRGIYFSDAAQYAAQYVYPQADAPHGYLLLAEVAVGASNEVRNHTAATPESLAAAGRHSVKALGMLEPDPRASVSAADGVEFPLGPLVRSATLVSPVDYNEYVVFDSAQVILRYLVRVVFHGALPQA